MIKAIFHYFVSFLCYTEFVKMSAISFNIGRISKLNFLSGLMPVL